jgi:hypothetical protein
MKNFLSKKIYGFSILEIIIGSFVLFNFKTIFSLFGLVSKPVENAVNDIADKQIEQQTGLSKNMIEFSKQLAPKIKVHLDSWNTDEKALAKLLHDTITSSLYWDSIQKYYNQKYSADLRSELYSCFDDFGFKTTYKNILKRTFLIADLL